MAHDTTTQCRLFPGIFSKPVKAQFDQRQGSSDGGAMLLKAADQRRGLTESLAACLVDKRQAAKVQHETEELLGQRVYGLAWGYADANDAARLAADPVHKLLVGRDPVEGAELASPPTLSRFENAPDRKQLYRLGEALAECVIERHCRRRDGRAQAWTLRERLLKLSAQVKVSVRRVVIHLSISFAFLSCVRRIARPSEPQADSSSILSQSSILPLRRAAPRQVSAESARLPPPARHPIRHNSSRGRPSSKTKRTWLQRAPIRASLRSHE